jgi:hypothetical protein
MLVKLRRAGMLDDEFDASGNRIHDENIVQEFMEPPTEDHERGDSNETGFSNKTPESWCVSSALTHILEHSDLVINCNLHNALISALTDHLRALHSSSTA